jgi:multicomponent Na+:H+ antiporter subunit D
MIGGLSISAFPLFSGFVSKTMTIEAAELIHRPVIYLMLECASIGTFLHTGLKLPWNIWLQGKKAPPAEIEAKLKDSAFNSPLNMLISMGILAFLCILLGVFPKILYNMLPYPVEFVPYTLTRVFSLTQMFIFTFLGFWLLRKLVVGHPTYTLDTDWLIRIPGRLFLRFCEGPLLAFGTFLDKNISRIAASFIATIRNPSLGMRMTPMAIGFGVLMALVLFSIFLVLQI